MKSGLTYEQRGAQMEKFHTILDERGFVFDRVWSNWKRAGKPKIRVSLQGLHWYVEFSDPCGRWVLIGRIEYNGDDAAPFDLALNEFMAKAHGLWRIKADKLIQELKEV